MLVQVCSIPIQPNLPETRMGDNKGIYCPGTDYGHPDQSRLNPDQPDCGLLDHDQLYPSQPDPFIQFMHSFFIATI